MKYLRTLEDWFDKLNNEGEFPKLVEVRDINRRQALIVSFPAHESVRWPAQNLGRDIFYRYTLEDNNHMRITWRVDEMLRPSRFTTWRHLVPCPLLPRPRRFTSVDIVIAALQANTAYHSLDMEKQQALQHAGPTGGAHSGNLQQPHYPSLQVQQRRANLHAH